MNSHIPFILSGFIASLTLSFFITPAFISLLRRLKLGKQIREEALIGRATEFARLHQAKTGTPTMGGLVILLSTFILVGASIIGHMLGWQIGSLDLELSHSLWSREETYLPLATLAIVGLIGMIDDYLNVREIGKTKGLSARVKMLLLTIFWLVAAWWFYVKLGKTNLDIPFFSTISISWLSVPIFVLIIVGMANSVNITDGLDGLAGGLLLFNYTVYSFICYQQQLYILSTLCMVVAGGLVSFLWFNVKPAKFYMGDLGSLSLGAMLAIIAMTTNTLFILLITGSVFFLEIFSVILQITSKKLRKWKKIFRIAPFHHHLEAIGWDEETIVLRFWLVGMITAISGLIIAFIWK